MGETRVKVPRNSLPILVALYLNRGLPGSTVYDLSTGRQVAPTMTASTRPHSFTVPLQLFADHNFL